MEFVLHLKIRLQKLRSALLSGQGVTGKELDREGCGAPSSLRRHLFYSTRASWLPEPLCCHHLG